MKRCLIVACLAALLVPAEMRAQDSQEDAAAMQAGMEALQLALIQMGDGRYLESLETINSIDPLPPSLAQIAAELVGNSRAFVGDYDGAIEAYNSVHSQEPDAVPEDVLSESFVVRDAIEAIREAAHGRRVVMINEAHNVPRHRAFTTLLMNALAEDGFTAFAAEGFHTETDLRVRTNGYPQHGDSAYIQDPFFAGMVREAVRLGMELVWYEQQPEQTCLPDCTHQERAAERERVQAENLANYLEQNPNARVLVHVGYGHHNESRPNGYTFMGGHFADITGIDPLTVSQTAGTPMVFPGRRLLLQHLNEHYEINSPSILFGAQSNPFRISEGIDLSVIHPIVGDVCHRPTWTAMNGYRRPVPISLESAPAQRPMVLMAFASGEPNAAIPIDQLIVEGEEEEVCLMLPNGQYRLAAAVSGSEYVSLRNVEVD